VQLALASRSGHNEDFAAFSQERLLNLYARNWPSDAKSPVLIRRTPGLTTFCDLGTSAPVRAMIGHDDRVYAVSGGAAFAVSSAGVATKIGTVHNSPNTTTGSNGAGEIAFGAGGTYYVWDGSTFRTVAMTNLTAVQQITSDGQYVLLSDTTTDRIASSGINNAANLPALDFSDADIRPDGTVGIVWHVSYLWVFGTKTIEVWRNVGADNFPYKREAGTTIERGCFASKSIATEGSNVFFVGDDRIAYRLSGGSIEPISTPAVSRAIEQYDSGANIIGFCWSEQGHKFYGIRFPDRATWVFDLLSGEWHERSSHQTDDTTPWKGVCAILHFGRQLIGGDDGVVYEIDGNAFSDGATTVQRVLQTPPVANGQQTTVDEVSIDIKTGFTDIARDQQVALQISEDGVTWSPEIFRNAGQIGDYRRRISWHGLGQAWEHHFRFRVTDPIDISIYGGGIEVS
jgi:hypothetical protein